MRAALAPKSSEDSLAVNPMAPPPGTGSPSPVNCGFAVASQTDLRRVWINLACPRLQPGIPGPP